MNSIYRGGLFLVIISFAAFAQAQYRCTQSLSVLDGSGRNLGSFSMPAVLPDCATLNKDANIRSNCDIQRELGSRYVYMINSTTASSIYRVLSRVHVYSNAGAFIKTLPVVEKVCPPVTLAAEKDMQIVQLNHQVTMLNYQIFNLNSTINYLNCQISYLYSIYAGGAPITPTCQAILFPGGGSGGDGGDGGGDGGYGGDGA